MLGKNHMLFTVFKQTATGTVEVEDNYPLNTPVLDPDPALKTHSPPTLIQLGSRPAHVKSNSNFYLMREKHLIG